MSAKQVGHAVVVGSGMAGLVTSRVLADYFEHVTLLERDAAPPDAGSRPGVPQGRHFHALLPGGLLILAELFPGFPEQLRAAGSLLPGPDEFYFFRPEGKSYALGAYMPKPRPDDGRRLMYVQSRGLLEHCVRSRVAAFDNVELRYGARVEDITAADGRITGVKVAHAAEPISADLVIDATGRGGKTLQWLDQLGFERPAQDVVNCDFAYTRLTCASSIEGSSIRLIATAIARIRCRWPICEFSLPLHAAGLASAAARSLLLLRRMRYLQSCR